MVATRAPQRSNACSGPISASVPSTATVCPSSRSHSGWRHHRTELGRRPTVPTLPPPPTNRAAGPAHLRTTARRETASEPSFGLTGATDLHRAQCSPGRVVQHRAEGYLAAVRLPVSHASVHRRHTVARNRHRGLLEAKPASRTLRKCTRYPRRQLVSCSARSAPTASTPRKASATTARPRTELLRRPPGSAGTTTPVPSPLIIASRRFASPSRSTSTHLRPLHDSSRLLIGQAIDDAKRTRVTRASTSYTPVRTAAQKGGSRPQSPAGCVRRRNRRLLTGCPRH